MSPLGWACPCLSSWAQLWSSSPWAVMFPQSTLEPVNRNKRCCRIEFNRNELNSLWAENSIDSSLSVIMRWLRYIDNRYECICAQKLRASTFVVALFVITPKFLKPPSAIWCGVFTQWNVTQQRLNKLKPQASVGGENCLEMCRGIQSYSAGAACTGVVWGERMGGCPAQQVAWRQTTRKPLCWVSRAGGNAGHL